MFRTMRLPPFFSSYSLGISALSRVWHAHGCVVVGTLSCNVASGFGFDLRSSRAHLALSRACAGMNITSGTTRDSVDIGYIQSGNAGLDRVRTGPTPLRPAALAVTLCGGNGHARLASAWRHALVGAVNSSSRCNPQFRSQSRTSRRPPGLEHYPHIRSLI